MQVIEMYEDQFRISKTTEILGNFHEERLDMKLNDNRYCLLKGTVKDNTTDYPLNEVCIKITDYKNNPIIHFFTDSKGFFEVKYPFPDYIKIIAAKLGYRTYSSNCMSLEECNKMLEIRLQPIKNQENIIIGSVKDECRNPAAFIKITLMSLTQEDKIYETYTNQQGMYVLKGVEYGIYRMIFNSPFYYSYYCFLQVNRCLKIYNIDTIYLKFRNLKGTINGIICDDDGIGIEDALVVLINANVNKAVNFTYTNSEGVYLFYNLPVGKYYILAKK